MRKAVIVSFPVLAVVLLAALAALWPLGALAGPTAQSAAPAGIQSLVFANSPSADAYAAGEQIRITATFDRNVTVSGQPQLDIDVGGQTRRAAYYQGSGTPNLMFAYTVQQTDWDGNGVSVPAGALTLNGGTITAGDNIAASLTHSGIADDASRQVKGAADTDPTFGLAIISAQTYPRGTAITDLTLPAATGGNGLLTYSLSPEPPDGLAFNAVARILSGTPTTTQNAVTYTYSVTDASSDIVSLSFTITVDGTPSFPTDVVAAQTYAKGVAITNLTLPAASDGNTPLTYSLTPTLPDGLVFNSTTRVISGAPTTTQNAVTYTYTVTDADGDTATQSFTITVDGAPTFPANAVAAQTYPRGAAITRLTLPAASGGNTPLTYSLSPALPDGLVFDAVTRTISGTPALGQAATTYTYTVTDADGDTATKSFTIAVTGDYDLDDDGLIEIDRLAQLTAVRWDLNGDGAIDTGTSVTDTAKYRAAFPNPAAGMGCPLSDHDDDTTTANIPVCIGYELAQNLDFDTDGDGATYTVSSAGVVTGDADDAYYNGGQGWLPIGSGSSSANQFAATFDGKDKTISNLYINRTGAPGDIGLFGAIAAAGVVQNLGLPEVSVNYASASTGGAIGSLAGRSYGTVTDCYATGTVATGSVPSGTAFTTGGLVGFLRGGKISSSYSAVAVSGKDGIVGNPGSRNRIGGLVGRASGSSVAVIASYATGAVTVGSGGRAGGLVGTFSDGAITASYATGPVAAGAGGLSGALIGLVSRRGAVTASYATGAVAHNGSIVGGLIRGYSSAITHSYWDTGSAGPTIHSRGAGYTTRELQSPTGYTGIYANWNANLDGVAGNDDPWDFGTSRQYPVLKYGGLAPAQQRRTSIQSDNWNAPVVGEPVTAALSGVVVDAGASWLWQSSTDGSTWTDIAGSTYPIYVPVAADAANGGKFLRAKVTFTASGKSQTLTTVNTARVVTAATATAGAAATVVTMVGKPLHYQHAAFTAAGAANRTGWQWQRCDDAAMTTNCKLRGQSNSLTDAHTAYTPVAGADTDVGKYLRAYAYYSDSGNSNAWTRTQTPVLGPVVTAPAATPMLSP